jgi:hypothetical protein
MKKPRRAIVSEPLYGTSIEVYANYPQKVALRRCAKVMDMDADDPANAPDDTAASPATSSPATRRPAPILLDTMTRASAQN